ncbi:MAG: peptidase M75 [Chloroflexi bacterium]|nr:peptidase M75 [Chloroflexota bacterium]
MTRLIRVLLVVVCLLQALPRPVAAQGAPSEADVALAYVDNVVLPTYTLLAQRLTALKSAVVTLRQSPTPGNLQAARAAWLAAREPWEWSESFLFGPVSSLALDPALDSWPISEDNLKALLAETTPLNAAVVEGLEPDVKGYHSLELILYGEKGAKEASALTPRELEYAQLVAEDMEGIGQTLVAAWTSGVEGEPAFRSVVTGAGAGNAVYASSSAVVEELLVGITDILNEVAEEKIGLPLDNRDPALAESWYSQTSIDDYRNNVQGALQAYAGALPGRAAATSLQALVKAKDPALDADIMAGFQRTRAALDAIPAPFEQSVLNAASSAQARAARNAAADLADLFDNETYALLIGEHEAPDVAPADQLMELSTAIDDASQALGRGDVAAAQTAFRRFDDGWGDVEAGIRSASRERYREIESAIAEVRSTLLKPAQPDRAAASAALTKLRSVIDTALPELR